MKVLFALAALVAVACAIPTNFNSVHVHQNINAHVDKDVAIKQKLILQLLVRVQQPLMYPELKELGKNWNPEQIVNQYANQYVVKKFMSMHQQGMLPQGEIFHLYNDSQLKEAIALFDMLYFAKDFDTFIKTAAWARDNVNEGQFTYALCVATIHRDDTNGVVLPPMYEVYPHLYFHGSDIAEFQSAKMQGKVNYETLTNWTVGNEIVHPEDLLGYFTQDVGLNAYHAYAHLYNPFWLNAEKYGLNINNNRGENFYYFYQQILAHYNLHRMANYLPEMNDFDWNMPIEYGYNPDLKYHSGKAFPARPENSELTSLKSYTVEDVKMIEKRIKDAIDSGYVIGKDGNVISIKNHIHGINILGNIIEGNDDAVNSRYYGSYTTMLHNLVALIVDPSNEHGVAPGVIGHYETALRDPAFYYIQKHINGLFKQYKDNLPYYHRQELNFNGVAVKDVAVSKLVTYFDLFNVDVAHSVDVNSADEAEKIHFVAKTMRLNHKPFSYKVKVVSDKKTQGVLRVFLGPNTDYIHSNFYGDQASDVYYGHDTADLERLRHMFVELDRIPVELSQGENLIERHSREFTSTVGDIESFKSLQKMAESGNVYVHDVDHHCGFPDRLVLPMGHKAGLPLTLFVMVTPYGSEEQQQHGDYYHNDNIVHHQGQNVVSCNGLMTVVDNRPLGFPFDRQIDNYGKFTVPNMYFKNVAVYHKDSTVSHQQQQQYYYQHAEVANDFDHLPKYVSGQHQIVSDINDELHY
ncbi:allergen Cr-PI-like [Frankliniella occidentalis]|uniref:Allergen Cr-PI-like n=1 Tax=Frankliniella occidentalis TaxID=133901 RepID=A0A6J1TCU3_FRAOC|nr:allergen Cr-PI-like [Frankliniella occidentalis]